VPYVPVMGLVGTDLLARRDDMIVAPDPFGSGKSTVVARAMQPDVAIFHVEKADRSGNCSAGYPVEAVVLAEASRHVIVSAEEIVDRVSEKEAVGCFLPGILVDRVAHAPFGAHPGAMTRHYGVDRAHMLRYVEASRDDASFAEYVQAHVFSVADHAEYVARFVPRELQEAARNRVA
jgi:glutaconate CoA-transferase subunit A